MHEFPFALGTNFSIPHAPIWHVCVCVEGGEGALPASLLSTPSWSAPAFSIAQNIFDFALTAPLLPLVLSLTRLKDIFHMCRTHAQSRSVTPTLPPLPSPLPLPAVDATVFGRCLQNANANSIRISKTETGICVL